MPNRLSSLLLSLLCLVTTACTTTYGPMGLNGGYKDERVNATTYKLVFEAASMSMGGGVVGYEQVEAFWHRRARELCGSEDYFIDLEKQSYNGMGQVDSFGGVPVVYGLVYCNNKFTDSRKQAPDAQFAKYSQLSMEDLQYQEISPLWDLLMGDRYDELARKLEELVTTYEDGAISETQLATNLGVFSRVNPAVEPHFQRWQQSYPDSYLAYWAEATYLHQLALVKKGHDNWSQVTSEGKSAFFRYRDMAERAIDQSLQRNPEFCLAYVEKIAIQSSKKEPMVRIASHPTDQTFATGKAVCPGSVELHKSYLATFPQRRDKQMEDMRSFIDEALSQSSAFDALEAYYLIEAASESMSQRKIEAALRKAQQAVKAGPSAIAYRQLGLANEFLNNYMEAIENYRIAIGLDPYFQIGYLDLFRVLSKQGDYLGALKALNQLTALNNQVPVFYAGMGDMFYNLRRYDEAVISYKKASVLDPDSGIFKHKLRMAEYQIEVREDDQSETAVKTSI